MDILGEILKQVLEGAAQQQRQPQQRQPQPQQRPAPTQPPQGMPSADDLGDILGQIFGGGAAQKLPDVVRQFEEKGMRDQVESWVRTGPNKPVDRRQIEDVFGQRELDGFARTKGIDRDQLAEVLAKYIPRIIDELTPQGQLPRR
jgi:uncharacterized protein YidB (DUF937 family)